MLKKARSLIVEIVKFVGLSGIGWLLDVCVYTVLSLYFRQLALVNIISSLVGASFVFIFSTRYVFKDNHNIPLAWKYLIYIAYQLVLIFLISLLLAKINTLLTATFDIVFIRQYSALISKILVTPITMILNYVVMKFAIEKL